MVASSGSGSRCWRTGTDTSPTSTGWTRRGPATTSGPPSSWTPTRSVRPMMKMMLMMLLGVAKVHMRMLQVIRARVVGDLPVAFGIDEMVRQVGVVIPCKAQLALSCRSRSSKKPLPMGSTTGSSTPPLRYHLLAVLLPCHKVLSSFFLLPPPQAAEELLTRPPATSQDSHKVSSPRSPSSMS